MVDVDRLRIIIDQLGVPIITLAKKCDVSRNTFENWLKRPELITCNTAMILADALRITDESELLAIFFAKNVHK